VNRRFGSLASLVACGMASFASAATLSGRVLGPGGVPVVNCDQDVQDSATGTAISTIADHTNSSGVFSFAVPNGTYDIAFIPPAAARLADKKIFHVVVPGNTNLGDIVLDAAFLVTGHVVDSLGNALFDVDQDVDDSFTGVRQPTHADHTTAAGDFSFLMSAGSRDILVLPPKTTRAVARVLVGVVIAGDTNLGTITCPAGVLLSGHVTGPGSAPLAAIDMNVYDDSTGALVATVGDNTDAAGSYSIIVPTGSITLDAEPPMGLGLAHLRTSGIAVSGDRTFDVSLPATPAAVGIARSGRLAIAGANYAYSVRVRNTTPALERISATIAVRDPLSGASGTIVGPVRARLAANFGPASRDLSFHVPGNAPPRFRGRPLDLTIVVSDATSGAVLDSDVTQFTIR
jgi:hypothetical protein